MKGVSLCTEIIYTFRTHLHAIFVQKNSLQYPDILRNFLNKSDANLSTNCTNYFDTAPKRTIMQKGFERKIIVSLAVLAVFGFFCFFREEAFDGYVGRADSAKQAGDEGEALENLIFANALDEKNRDVGISVKRAEVFYGRGDYAAAERELTQALQSDDGDSALYEFLGKVKNAEGDYAQAEKYYSGAFEIKANARLAIERAKNLVRGGKSSEAELVLQKTSGEDAAYYFGLIKANEGGYSAEDFEKIRNGKYKSNIALVEKFFKSEDDRAGSDYDLVSRADLFRKIGEEELVFANLDIVLARNGKYRDAYLVEGKTLTAAGKYDRALESFEKCLVLDSDNAEAIFYLGKIYEAAGDSEKAKAYGARYGSLSG